jgi:hypothetical protein
MFRQRYTLLFGKSAERYPYTLWKSDSYVVALSIHRRSKVDTPYLDDRDGLLGLSLMTQLGSVFDQAMSPKCASNVKSLMCRSTFKECRQVEDASGSLLWFPSLLCRSECERHQDMWSSCLEDIEKDPEAKQKFDERMIEMVKFTPSRSCALFFL